MCAAATDSEPRCHEVHARYHAARTPPCDRGDEVDDAFTRAVLTVDGVASVFGVNDFVTVTRVPGADWGPIVTAVEEAAARYLPACPGGPSTDAVAQARALLRDATRRPATTAVEN